MFGVKLKLNVSYYFSRAPLQFKLKKLSNKCILMHCSKGIHGSSGDMFGFTISEWQHLGVTQFSSGAEDCRDKNSENFRDSLFDVLSTLRRYQTKSKLYSVYPYASATSGTRGITQMMSVLLMEVGSRFLWLMCFDFGAQW